MAGTNATTRTFGLSSPEHMLEKLEWEAGLLYAAIAEKEAMNAPAYHALNAATTAWHIVDWVCDDLDERHAWPLAQAALGVGDKAAFTSLALAQRSLAACWQIANAWKHRSLDRSYRHGYETSDTFQFYEQDGKFGALRMIRVQMPNADLDVRIVMHDAIDWWTRTLTALGHIS